MSWHCREHDDDGGGPPTKVPRESIDDNPTRRHTRSSLPALDLEKCLLCDSKKKTKSCRSHEALYPLYLGVFPNNSAQRCSNINDARILMRISLKRRRVLLEIDQLTDLHAKEVMYHASSYRKYNSPKSLDSVAIIQRLSPMPATRQCLSTLMIEEWITDAYCIMSLLSHIVPYLWQVTAR